MEMVIHFLLPKFLLSVLNMQMKRLSCGFFFRGVIQQFPKLLSQLYLDYEVSHLTELLYWAYM